MKADRRDLLRAGAIAGAGALLGGCARILHHVDGPPMPESVALPPTGSDRTARLIERVSYGATPNELKRVTELGAEKYVEEQLKAERDEPLGLQFRLHNLDVFRSNPADLRDYHESEVLQQLQRAALLRAVYSPNQLRERMVDFWTNHFNIYARKGFGVYLQPVDHLRVVRENALGKFPEMLKASAKSPAMLSYLDNQVNEKGHPNENYAREIMELHTLGVHGGYTQKDVMEVARCLTGWGMQTGFLHFNPAGFRFEPDKHDKGRKVVLGHVIPPGGGVEDGDRVLDIITTHPSTAKFISTKICRHFMGEHVGVWPDRMADIYLRTGGDIQEMLRPLLLSEELVVGAPILKRPFDYIASAMRALNANTDCGPAVQDHLVRMGQPLYLWPMPDGYPDKTISWTGSLLGRWNFAIALASGQIPGTTSDVPQLVRKTGAQSDAEWADALTEIVFGRSVDSPAVRPVAGKVRTILASAATTGGNSRLGEATALALASPQFQWR